MTAAVLSLIAPIAEPRLRVTEDDGSEWECTLAEFAADNPEIAEDVDAIPVGESAYFGGGAAPLFLVARIS